MPANDPKIVKTDAKDNGTEEKSTISSIDDDDDDIKSTDDGYK